MSRVKLDPQVFAFSSIFERIARVPVKGCFSSEDTLFFVVPFGMFQKALGKGAENVKKAQKRFEKRIKIVEFNKDPARFVKNCIYPLSVEEISVIDGEIIIKDSNRKTKSLLIGRDARNLRLLNEMSRRYFEKEIKII